MRYSPLWLVPALLAVASACTDHDTPATATAPSGPVVIDQSAPADEQHARLERLARRTALALHRPEFRALVKTETDGSPFREHKLQFQRLLHRPDHRALAPMAAASGEREDGITRDADAASPLEFYFPVHGQREAWRGDENILVATAITDGDTPIAFDTHGGRHILSPDHPPAIPVLAVVPQETDLDHPGQGGPARMTCPVDICGGGGTGGGGGGTGGGAPAFPGLYMSYVQFSDSFEGWLKGDPEFEIHILGPSSAGNNSTYNTLWCIGEHGDTYWDLNGTTWQGDLMIYSQSQLDAFHAKYPGQNFSLLALEDDDTSCQVKVDNDNLAAFVGAVNDFSAQYKGAKDNIGLNGKTISAVKALWSLLSSAINWIKTNDDLIGVAIANSVTGYTHPIANWAFIGYDKGRYGWIRLDMK